MRLLADENVHTDIIQGLRKENFEVIFVPDIDLAGRKDREILEYAEKNVAEIHHGYDRPGGCPFDCGHPGDPGRSDHGETPVMSSNLTES
jgi:hypothetical protein